MKTFYKFLQENDPEFTQVLINMGIREKICNLAELYALEVAISEIKRNQKTTSEIITKCFNQ